MRWREGGREGGEGEREMSVSQHVRHNKYKKVCRAVYEMKGM